MRVLLGLAALAAVNAQTVAITGSTTQSYATSPLVGQTALSKITVTQGTQNGAQATVTPTTGGVNQAGVFATTNNYAIAVPNSVTVVVFTFVTNALTSQMQYRWNPGYSPAGFTAIQYTCDPCAGGTPTSCTTSTGPANGSLGYQCSNLTRYYTFSGLVAGTNGGQGINSFSVQQFDLQTNPGPDTSSYSFIITRAAPAIVGDPQIAGMQGQDFQVHGMPDEIFNMITYPNLQVNARFVYLSSGACHDNFTACFAHPGTYISEEGIRLGSDKIHVAAGSFKKGLTVSVNGKKVTDKKTSVKLGSVELVNHRRVVVTTPIMAITISNSDKFLNQETALFDQKLLTLGSSRRELLVGETFHPEVPLHGLQGQTWRNVEYPSGLEYEGSISDYHVTDGNLFGTKFVFNQYKH